MWEFAEAVTIFTSAIGIYQIIYTIWAMAEEAEIGQVITTKVDTVITVILTVIIVLFLMLVRLVENQK